MKTSTLYACASFLATTSAHTSSVYNIVGGGPRQLEELSFDPADTALVIIDPQNDFLSEDGVIWELVKESVEEHDTINHIEMLFDAAEKNGFYTFISPHYYFPHDMHWHFEGAVETVMHDIGAFDRAGPLSLEDFEGSGADWVETFKPYILDKERVIVTSPHKIYGPEANDLSLQLRKRKIDRIVLAGMSANLCVESHMRELIEQGFEVFVVQDATAGAKAPQGDGYAAALTNFKYIASGVIPTDAAVEAMGGSTISVGGDEDDQGGNGQGQQNGDNAQDTVPIEEGNRSLKATDDYAHHLSLAIGGFILAVGGYILAH